MIRIHRINPAPAILRTRGLAQMKLDCAAYEDAPQEYRSGRRHFDVKDYYKRTAVKDILLSMHHGKCCYCESKLPNLHVEHFRPKAAVRQCRAAKVEFPGYYWLTYSWRNLLLACLECNSTYKGAMFPLENPSRRARTHNDDVSRERRLFVNPAEEDPRRHIRFQEDLPVARTRRGRHTIQGLGLRRPNLTETRLEWFHIVDRHIDMVKLEPSSDNRALQREARRFIAKAMEPDAKFSSMVSDLVDSRGL